MGSLEYWFLGIHFTWSAVQAHGNHGPRRPGYCMYQWQILATSPWCWFFKNAECKTCVVMNMSTQISKEGLRGHKLCPWELGRRSCENEVRDAVEQHAVSIVQEKGWGHLGWGCSNSLGLTSHYHVPSMLDIELIDLMLALLDFSLALVLFFSIIHFSLLGWEC